MNFKDLKVSHDIIESLAARGITQPTPVQERSIPPLMRGEDVVCQSETGSGKTLAFALPIIERTVHSKRIQVVILAPTRELANQIRTDMVNASRQRALHIVNVYGGVSIEPQIQELAHADILIGTPGRVLDHMRRGTVNFAQVKFLVLDEADRMLDMGFIDDVETIIKALPRKRQTMLFSATMPPEVVRLSRRYMHAPKLVKTRAHVKREYLVQYYCDVLDHQKFSALIHLIKKEQPRSAIIFCSKRTVAEAVTGNMKKQGLDAQALHGGLSQSQRDSIMLSFRQGKLVFLVATDLASRGLDIEGVTHIFNYSIPDHYKDYTHRIGRTARAGKAGKAISIISPSDHQAFRRVLGDPEIQVIKIHIGHFRNIPFTPLRSSQHLYRDKRPARGRVRKRMYR
jgi:superfamily II DNA/RNA helicase